MRHECRGLSDMLVVYKIITGKGYDKKSIDPRCTTWDMTPEGHGIFRLHHISCS